MAVNTTGQESYLKALMYLGRAPRQGQALKDCQTQGDAYTSMEMYKVLMEYDSQVQKYFLKYVGGTIVGPEPWIEGFYRWQRAEARALPSTMGFGGVAQYRYKK